MSKDVSKGRAGVSVTRVRFDLFVSFFVDGRIHPTVVSVG